MRIRRKYRRTVLTLAAVCLLSIPVLAHTGSGIAVDRYRQVYFLDTGSGLWKVDAHGKLLRISGTMFHLTCMSSSTFTRRGTSGATGCLASGR
ncbi:MAG: hypothetical protein ACREBG_26900 [Pyrinomonadaceae bacterium]